MTEGGARGPGPILGQSDVVIEDVRETPCLPIEDAGAPEGAAATDIMPKSQCSRRALVRSAFRFGRGLHDTTDSIGRLTATIDGVAAVRLASSSLRVSVQLG